MSAFTSMGGRDQRKLEEICALEDRSGASFPRLKERFGGAGLSVWKDAEGAPRLVDGREVPDPLATLDVVNEIEEAFCVCTRGAAEVGMNVIVVIGMTGVGKSTLCNWLVGHRISTELDPEDDEVSKIKIERVDRLPMFGVGHSTVHSQTFLPTVVTLPYGDVVLVDFPGFFDSNGSEIRIGVDLGFRSMMCQMKGDVHVIALLPESSFDVAGRSCMATKQLNKLNRLLPPQGQSATWMLAISGCHKLFMLGAKKKYKHIEEHVVERFPELKGWICNVCDLMLAERASDHAAQDFVIGRVFGFQASKTLEGDCLDPDAVAEFSRIFNPRIVYNIIADALAGYDPKPQDRQGGRVVDDDDLDSSVEDEPIDGKLRQVLDNLGQQLHQVCKLRDMMKKARQHIDGGRLMVQEIFPSIDRLCQSKQPRLMQCFVEADKQAVIAMLRGCTDQFDALQTNCQQAVGVQGSVVAEDQQKQLQEALKSTHARLKENVRSLAFKDMGEFVATTNAVSEIMALAGDAAAAVATLAWLPSPAVVGMLVSVVVMADTVHSASIRSAQKEKVREIIQTAIQTSSALADASDAYKEYILVLTGKEKELTEGIVLEEVSRMG